MLFDPDHMSVKARNAALDQVEDATTPASCRATRGRPPTPTRASTGSAGSSRRTPATRPGFVEKWRRHLGWADPRYYFGFGYGADINGLGAQGDPRGADVPNPVTYPFHGLGGVTVRKQRSGERVYDINVDGVAQYGLYPDWIEDLRKVAGAKDGDAIFEDMAPRRRGLPADVGARGRRHERRVPRPAGARSGLDDPRAGPGARVPRRCCARGPAARAPRRHVHLLRATASGRDRRPRRRVRPARARLVRVASRSGAGGCSCPDHPRAELSTDGQMLTGLPDPGSANPRRQWPVHGSPRLPGSGWRTRWPL